MTRKPKPVWLRVQIPAETARAVGEAATLCGMDKQEWLAAALKRASIDHTYRRPKFRIAAAALLISLTGCASDSYWNQPLDPNDPTSQTNFDALGHAVDASLSIGMRLLGGW